MSELSITPYFPFRRIKITKQAVNKTATKAVINAVPDKRFPPNHATLRGINPFSFNI